MPPENIRPYISDMGALSLRGGTILGVRYLSTSSYLPGASKAKNYMLIEKIRCAHLGLVRIFVPEDNIKINRNYKNIALEVCDAWTQASGYFYGQKSIGAVSLTLVPEGVRYESGQTSLGLKNVTFKIAIRHYKRNKNLFFNRYLVRTFAHEFLHANLVFTSGPEIKKKNEETAAYLFESCVELDVIGSTFGDITGSKNNSIMMNHLHGRRDDIANSLAGGIKAEEILSNLGIIFPLFSSNQVASKKLKNECSSRISKLQS